jgi:GntR family transcriptional repressor for pyruvate dehydrogenase complex
MNTSSLHLKERSLITQAEEFLTGYILSGEVSPGDYLPPEQALSQKLGIGRNTLREAISILQAKGLVERQHGLGLRVIDRSQQAASEMLALMMQRNGAAAEDLLEVRRFYEVPAAACAAERANSEEMGAIRQALDAMRAPGVTKEEGAEADLEFHLAVARATHNVVLVSIVETIRSLLREAILLTMKNGFNPEYLHGRHVAIVEAIEQRDARRAAQAMEAHLHSTERLLRRAGAIAVEVPSERTALLTRRDADPEEG